MSNPRSTLRCLTRAQARAFPPQEFLGDALEGIGLGGALRLALLPLLGHRVGFAALGLPQLLGA